MKFFKLDNANESPITGPIYPQKIKFKNWCFENYEYLTAGLRPDKLPDKDFRLDYLELDPKAILTDFLTV